jgi:beta-phosphoglucomutase family hydrolase
VTVGHGLLAEVPSRWAAFLFDLDGVVTDTAAVHAAAWKALFDPFLRSWAATHGEPFVPLDPVADYRASIDGKERSAGVASFLASRGITLPAGHPDDDPAALTVAALGKRKDAAFLRVVETDGVRVFPDAVVLLDAVRAAGASTAVVSASRNCEMVLRRVGLLDRFDARVTGIELAAWDLPGKPAPDSFLRAAALLGVEPARAVVLEDAVAGVAAGRAGGFGLVVGVDRGGAAAGLAAAGADVVVGDLGLLAR